MSILIVEDEPRTAQELRAGLERGGFDAVVAASGEEAQGLANQGAFEALVVDVMLPGISGLDLVKRLREGGAKVPVLFLSARGGLEDRLLGLEIGGDDYLAKPYSILEVLARLHVLTRRNSRECPSRVEVADLLWEPEARRITRSGQRIDLGPKEYAILSLLLQNRGKVVSRRQLVQTVWGLEGTVDTNAVDVQILRLRRKVDEPFPVKLIRTLRGVGLLLDTDENR